ncbi:hypothetical protein ACBJ59_10340 [Nonomuraea sp. MTCD27]|uniref:hypothetical protein n=1 Tax=Nonomuraea sp. MTCD27 TaxID=1676747 RepID=UPI0035BF4BA9
MARNICTARAQAQPNQGVTTINDGVDQNPASTTRTDRYDAAADALLGDEANELHDFTDAEIRDPEFCRRRFRIMADELKAANRFVRSMAHTIRAYETMLSELGPPPEVRHAMTVRTGSMHGVPVTVNGQDVVVVAPPDGFDDPDRTYRRIVQHYGRGDDR